MHVFILEMNSLLFVICFQSTLIYSSLTEERQQEDFLPANVQIIMGTKLESPEKMILPLMSGGSQMYFTYQEPRWRASAYLISELGDVNMKGSVFFHQYSPNHFIRVTVNLTGMPAGKHGVHIHTFGDISQGCKSTGMHMPNNFVGNIEAKPDGTVFTSFYSSFLSMFGFKGIVGRSVVIHSNPIDQNHHPNVFSSPVMVVPVNEMTLQSEETLLGKFLMCGVITITDNIEK